MSDLEQGIAETVSSEYNNFPVITLVSGERLIIREIQLYDEQKVMEISALKAQAADKLQGFSTGLGFWGSPGWVIGGSLALGFVENLISGSQQRQGLRTLRLAAQKFEALPDCSAFVSVERVQNLQNPNPQSWFATKKNGRVRYIHNGEDFMNVKTADGIICLRWSQVASYMPPNQTQTPAAALLPPPQAA
jgi:hypothetical protein